MIIISTTLSVNLLGFCFNNFLILIDTSNQQSAFLSCYIKNVDDVTMTINANASPYKKLILSGKLNSKLLSEDRFYCSSKNLAMMCCNNWLWLQENFREKLVTWKKNIKKKEKDHHLLTLK